jgi:hypothetical protein
MARQNTLKKYYYKNRQKNHSKKANNRRSIKKRTIGGMIQSLGKLVTRRRKIADSDPPPILHEPLIASDRGRRHSVLTRIPGVRYMTSGIRGSSVPAVRTSAVYMAPERPPGISDVAEYQTITSSDPVLSIKKDKILENSKILRNKRKEVDAIFRGSLTTFEKLTRVDNPNVAPDDIYDSVNTYWPTITTYISQLPKTEMDFDESETATDTILGYLVLINSKVLEFRLKLVSIGLKNKKLPFTTMEELDAFGNYLRCLEDIDKASEYKNFITITY